MTDLRRTVKCSNCGSESSVSFNSELEVRELLFAGKCRCGNSVQISYSIVGDSAMPSAPKPSGTEPPLVNIDESLFTPEIPSDTLRDLMED
ncbi:hypothetical protein L0Y65_02760 [Candidatus Micrarchaeota archaeon]|nr:hypothetical protein [Candidatus Micrarchaeota archaeon]